MRRPFKFTLFFSAGLLLAFFLPWINVLFFDASAFQLPRYISNLWAIQLADGTIRHDYSGYLLYLIPLCSVLGICRDLLRVKIWYWDYSCSLLITLAFMGFVILKGKELPISFGIGCYLTLALSGGGLLYGILSRDSQQPLVAENKSALFRELADLQALKEKGVITEAVFAVRRDELLQAIAAQEAFK